VAETRVVTRERFAKGMTFEEYVRFVGTPENLARESILLGRLAPRRNWSAFLRERYAKAMLTEAEAASIRWLAAQPGGPAHVLVIAEEWSSDCRRDLPYLQRLAEAGELELRIFIRDGARALASGRPDPAQSENADLMLAYMNRRGSEEYASIPVAVFLDRDFNELYRYIEYPAIYRKDALMAKLREARPGEEATQTRERFVKAFYELFESPLYDVWAHAALSEILSAMHERRVLAGT
jgi:hypothetical protein